MKSWEATAMEIIAMVGTARSYYIEAIQSAKAAEFDRALEQLELGDEAFRNGQKAHAALLQQEANGVLASVTLLMTHAEDQLMNAETFQILSREWLALYQRLAKPTRE